VVHELRDLLLLALSGAEVNASPIGWRRAGRHHICSDAKLFEKLRERAFAAWADQRSLVAMEKTDVIGKRLYQVA
jgi:hypothetical protein